jgi:hypothetical protein
MRVWAWGLAAVFCLSSTTWAQEDAAAREAPDGVLGDLSGDEAPAPADVTVDDPNAVVEGEAPGEPADDAGLAPSDAVETPTDPEEVFDEPPVLDDERAEIVDESEALTREPTSLAMTVLAQVASGVAAVYAVRLLLMFASPALGLLNAIPCVGPLANTAIQTVLPMVLPPAAVGWVGNGLSHKNGGLLPTVLGGCLTLGGCGLVNAFGLFGWVFAGAVAITLGYSGLLLGATVGDLRSAGGAGGLMALGMAAVAIGISSYFAMDFVAVVVGSSVATGVYHATAGDPSPKSPGWGIPPVVDADAHDGLLPWVPRVATVDADMAF